MEFVWITYYDNIVVSLNKRFNIGDCDWCASLFTEIDVILDSQIYQVTIFTMVKLSKILGEGLPLFTLGKRSVASVFEFDPSLPVARHFNSMVKPIHGDYSEPALQRIQLMHRQRIQLMQRQSIQLMHGQRIQLMHRQRIQLMHRQRIQLMQRQRIELMHKQSIQLMHRQRI